MTPAPAYVVERFPERSQTFVQGELRGLRRRGVAAAVYALYPAADFDDEAGDIPFVRIPSLGARRAVLASALSRVAARHPGGLARTAALAGAAPSRFQLHCLAKAVVLADLVGRAPPPWFHAHFARASASVAMLAAAIVGVPFSFTSHGGDLFLAPFDLPRKLRRAAVSVTVCDYNRRWIEEQWPGAGRLAVVPCGVDTGSFTRRLPYPADAFHVVAVGRLVPKKGFSDLVEACAALRGQKPDFRCTLAGDGPLRAELSDAVERHGLSGQVSLVGSLPPRDVRALLETASVLCLPAVVAADGDRDSQPLVLKEAMSMEIPVVATRAVGIPEIVDDRVGRLVPPSDPAALAAALAELARVPAPERTALGAAGRSRVVEGFSLDGQVSGLLSAWEQAGLGGTARVI